LLSRQGQTSRGSALLVVNNLGEFTVIVEAAGYESPQKEEVSVRVTGRTQVDVYLRRLSAGGRTGGVPRRALFAPKAKEVLEKGSQALSADKTGEAEKYVGEAMPLAPGHPDVLYVQGVLSLKQHNWAQGQDALEKVTQIDPSHARAFAELGMALCDQGKYGAAIAPLEESLQWDAAGSWETRWKIELLVAQSLTAVGRYEDAAQVLRAFLRDYGDRRDVGDRATLVGATHS
jgi:tetratricopeptide (TPR) repeat protein